MTEWGDCGCALSLVVKATKAQALACYDSFFGTLRCLNGGTRDENEQNAPRCLALLERDAKLAAELAANPGKRLAADAWLMEALTVTIPGRVASFEAQYFPKASSPAIAPVIPFAPA